jgi:hypothetical protein
MPTQYNNLLQKLERAAAAVYTATATAPITTQAGLNDSTQVVPSMTFIGQQGQEFIQGSGNFLCTLVVRLSTSIDETASSDHGQLAADAFDVFMRDDIASLLSGATGAQSNFHVIGVLNPRVTERTEERLQISELELDCLAAATDL